MVAFLKVNLVFFMSPNSMGNQFFIGFDRWQANISHQLVEAGRWSMNLQSLHRCAVVAITLISALALLPLIALGGLAFSAIYLARQYMVSPAERGGYDFTTAGAKQLLRQILKRKGTHVSEQPASRSLHRCSLLSIEQDQKFNSTHVAVSSLLQMVRLVNRYSRSWPTPRREAFSLPVLELSGRVNRFAIQTIGSIPYLPLVGSVCALCPIMFSAGPLSPNYVVLGCQLPPSEAVQSLDIGERFKQKSEPFSDGLEVYNFLDIEEIEKPNSRAGTTGKLVLQGYIQRTTRSFLNIMRDRDDEVNKMIELSLTMLADFSSAILRRNGARTDEEVTSFVQIRYRHLFKVTECLESALKAKCVTFQRALTFFTPRSQEEEFCLNIQQMPEELKQGIRNFSLDLQELPGIGLTLINWVLSPARHAQVVKFFEALISGKKVEVETTSWWRGVEVEQKSADEILDDLLPFGTNGIMSHFIVKNVRKLFEIQEQLTRAQALDEIRNRIIQVDNNRNMEQLKIEKSIYFVQKVLPHFLSRIMGVLEGIRALEEGQEVDGLMLLIKSGREIYYEVVGFEPEEYNLEIQEAQVPLPKTRSIVRNQIGH